MRQDLVDQQSVYLQLQFVTGMYPPPETVDLDGSPRIAAPHLQEAISYRCLDKSSAVPGY